MNKLQPLQPQPKDNRGELIEGIFQILNQFYPENIVIFAGLAYSRNHAVAEKLAILVESAKERDRKFVESQLLALLAAFQIGGN